jgi:gamma-glutamylcyclotransferase (GGCT)/AIG2-like uncharacterized protein YtfP
MSAEPHHILLYGTLRAGQQAFSEHRLGGSLRPAGTTFVQGQLYHLGEYPGVILGGSRRVLVERHEIIDRSVLSRLDRYEEYDPADTRPFNPHTGRGSMFIRRIVRALDLPAYIYEYNGPLMHATLVEDEDWLKFVAERSRDR